MAKATEILAALGEAAEGQPRVTLGRINDHVGHRGTGALLMVPPVLELTPFGGIPGVPTLLALIVAVFAVQIALGRDDMWLPHMLENRSVDAAKVDAGIEKLKPAAAWADRHLGNHLHLLVDPPAPRVVALAILALCCAVPVLELVPFASSIPMLTILLFGLALVMRDGRVMAVAWAAFAAALFGVWRLWP